jgi:hypothetical protein
MKMPEHKPDWYHRIASGPYHEAKPTLEQISRIHDSLKPGVRKKPKVFAGVALISLILIAFFFSAEIRGHIKKPVTVTPQEPQWGITFPVTGSNVPLIAMRFVNDHEGWAINRKKDGGLEVFHTNDQKGPWHSASLPSLSNDMIGSTVIPFMQEGLPAWVLVLSDPAAGMMTKTLFRTDDSGNSWIRLGEFSTDIPGYITGMTFVSSSEGWMTAQYRGEDTSHVPLFHTSDGGKTWKLQPLAVPAGYRYANAFPPVFDSPGGFNGIFPIELVGESSEVFLYETSDGGRTWKKGRMAEIGPTRFFTTLGSWAAGEDGAAWYSSGKPSDGTQLYLSNGQGWKVFGGKMVKMEKKIP